MNAVEKTNIKIGVIYTVIGGILYYIIINYFAQLFKKGLAEVWVFLFQNNIIVPGWILVLLLILIILGAIQFFYNFIGNPKKPIADDITTVKNFLKKEVKKFRNS